MKKILFLVLVSTLFSIFTIHAQERIVIGVKFDFPSEAIQDSISQGRFNLYDSFEYEFLSLFNKYATEHDYPTLEFKKINQSKRLTYLNKNEVDAIVYSLSITKERIDNGFLFSIPYFSNKSIVLVSNNPKIEVRKLHKSKTRIGFIKNTTADTELQLVKNKYPENVVLTGYSDFNKLITDLKEDKIDAVSGDISRLASFLLTGDMYFAGNLPTTRAQIEDKYGVVSKNPEVVKLFNQFIKDNNIQITDLKNKWFSNVEYLYQNYYSRNSFSFKTLIYSIIGSLLLLLLVILFFLKKLNKLKDEKEKMRSEAMLDTTTEKISNLLELVSTKFREKLDTKQVVSVGTEFFDTAKEKVTYIGSGGFLADRNYGKDWKNAIHNSLNRGIVLDRIVDLPQIDFGTLKFKNMDYFHPETFDDKYVKKYLKWLILQYIDFLNFGENYQIHNSRGASLWGYGIVIMIKDDEEVLLFTTNQDKKIGLTIANKELATYFADLMKVIKSVGKSINEHDLERDFFNTENNLKSLITDFKNDFQDGSSIVFTKEMNKRINDLSIKINDRFNKANHAK